MGVHHDVFTSEAALVADGRVDEAAGLLEAEGLTYVGTLPPPKGKPVEDWEPVPLPLFRSTQFGDDVDRPLKGSSGEWTYFAKDLAYHLDKYRRGFAELIDVWGADHGGYIKRMQAGVRALSAERVAPRRQDLPAGQPSGRRPAAADVEAGRADRDLARRGRRGRQGRGPLHHADPPQRRAARFRSGEGDRAVARQPGLVRAVRPRPDQLGAAPRRGGRAGGRPDAPAGMRRSIC